MNLFRRLWCAAAHRNRHVYVERGYFHRLWACRQCRRRWTEVMR